MLQQLPKKILLNLFVLSAAFMLFTSCEKAVQETAAIQLDLEFVALTKDLVLKTYNANNLGAPLKSAQVTGLQSAETILGIDFRPATGQLYALGNTSRIYTIDLNTGIANQIGSGSFTPALSGIIAGFNFNPLFDYIRIVTSTGQNLSVNPETGAVLNVDANINGVPGAQISALAYTNSSPVASSTVQYDVDVNNKKLYTQGPENGKLALVGSLTIDNASGAAGFDVSYDGIALAATSNGGPSTLYQLNLTTGASTSLGSFAERIIGLSIPTEHVAYILDASNELLSYNLLKGLGGGGYVSNLAPGELLLGYDFRPANGRLYALGRTSRLYTINLRTREATQVGTAPFTPLLSGTSFGFDFDPVSDRIRVVSNTGQNLRLNPNTGLVAGVDANLNPGSPAVTSAAYSNNFAGATSTTLYVIDYQTDHLYKLDQANNGTLTDIGPLGVDVEAESGFDIGGTTGAAFALLRLPSETAYHPTNMYSINLNTGAATLIRSVSGPNSTFNGLAVGLGN